MSNARVGLGDSGFRFVMEPLQHRRFGDAFAEISGLHEGSRRYGSGGGLLLMGPSGSGKSRLLEAYEKRFPRQHGRSATTVPVLRLSVPPSPTSKSLAESILYELGDPGAHRGSGTQKTNRVYELFRPLQEAFEVWLVEQWKRGLGRRNRRLGDLLLDGVRWVPAMAAASSLGISVERLKFLVKEQVIEGVETVSGQGRRFLTVRKDQIEALRPQILHEVDLKTATEMLGLSRVRMRGLFRLLFPRLGRTLPGDSGSWVIARSEVEELLELGRNLPVVGIQGEGQVSLADQLRYHDWDAEEIVELIAAVRRQEIQVVGLLDGVAGVPRWVFEGQALAIWRQKRGVSDKEWLSIQEVSRRLETRHEVVLWLVRQGVMKGEKLASAKGVGDRIPRAAVQEFRENYLFAADAAKELESSSIRLRKSLAALGVHPVSIDGVGPCRQLFYKRSGDLSKALSKIGQGGDDLLGMVLK